jgi:hypothetical protein
LLESTDGATIGDMRTLILATALIVALPLAAQTTKQVTPAAAPAVPTISDAQRAEFFKAQSMMIQSATQAKTEQSNFQAAIAKLQQTCGETFTLQMSPSGDPICVAKK